MSFDSVINSIGDQSSKVNDLMEGLGDIEDPAELTEASMKLMTEQNRLSTMSDSFAKTTKKLHEAVKSAIDNM